ncbi:DUF3696 domain-containing protein [Photobacterium sp. S4TG1]|uniref:DUF3696 domain-containing protein n=1 Tax=Photobacterium sp. S4TG1 TaxID=3114587 RepID=UPI002E192AF2|nr:DUF3696 domain-containing protein [Photobacterium sp. S4TG1]
MINKIKLENFKCYRKVEFNLSSLTVFCGNNSVGKSTAIQSLAIVFQNKFKKELYLKGNLVDFSDVKDIFSRHAEVEDSHLRVSLDIDKVTYSWGVDDEKEQSLLRNKLVIKSDEVHNKIPELYFNDKGFQFLQAERFGPRVYLENNNDELIINWLGSKGEYTFDVLAHVSNQLKRLSDEDKRIFNNSEGTSIRRNIINWMSEISPGFNFQSDTVTDVGISHAQFSAYGSANTKPIHMGFGLSYSLGIVCALLLTQPGGLVIIENPEAHLHPRGQSYLGRLIARAALSGVQVIIETHSDHLLNGIRVAAKLDNDYEDGEFKVFYVIGVPNSESEVKDINIGCNGQLSEWPDGFFDQQAMDIKTLLKGEEASSSRERI